MLEVGMERPTATGEPAWTELGDRIERAERLISTDPLLAIAQLGDVTEDLEELRKYAVMEARKKGHTWQEIAAVTGVEDRQAAWRRWTDKGVPKSRKKESGPELSTP